MEITRLKKKMPFSVYSPRLITAVVPVVEKTVTGEGKIVSGKIQIIPEEKIFSCRIFLSIPHLRPSTCRKSPVQKGRRLTAPQHGGRIDIIKNSTYENFSKKTAEKVFRGKSFAVSSHLDTTGRQPSPTIPQ